MKIAIITNKTKDIGLVTAIRAARLLEKRAEVIMPDDCILPEALNVRYIPCDRLWDEAEMMLVIGGDGTLLGASSPR